MILDELQPRARLANAIGVPLYVTAAEWPRLWAEALLLFGARPEVEGADPGGPQSPARPPDGFRVWGADVELSDPLAGDQIRELERWLAHGVRLDRHGRPPDGP
jgi:hypothetical protein